MGHIEEVIQLTRQIESLLEQAGANGRGLHQKITSVEGSLDDRTVRSLRWIATMRNKTVHEDGFAIDDVDGFRETCREVIDQLKASIAPARSTGLSTGCLKWLVAGGVGLVLLLLRAC